MGPRDGTPIGVIFGKKVGKFIQNCKDKAEESKRKEPERLQQQINIEKKKLELEKIRNQRSKLKDSSSGPSILTAMSGHAGIGDGLFREDKKNKKDYIR
jgi:hypothetical protein